MKSDEALAAEQSLEGKFEELGFGRQARGNVAAEQAAAPDEGTPAETVQADEQPRNELGQFTSPEPAAEAEQIAPPEGETQDNRDPAVAAFLAKYGGDVDKALAGAVHLQRRAGEQSNEVGELRQMVQELSQIRESFQNQPQAPQVLDQATVDWFDEQAMMNPQGAAEYARQQGNDILLQRALNTWKDLDPYGASVYTNDLRLQQMNQQFEQRLAAAQQLPMDTNMHMALTSVRSNHPEYTNYDDALADTLQRYPAVQQSIQSAAASGDRTQLEAAIETAYALAQGDTLRSLALTGPAPVETTTTSEVVAPTTSEDHGKEPEVLSPAQQMKAAMNEEIAARRRGVFVAE